MEFLTCWLPDHWASALFYDDFSGLESEELDKLEAFIEGEGLSFPVGFEDEQEGQEVSPSFMKYHDAQPYGVLACDCLPYLFPMPEVS
jgi:hypothetical protein